MLIEIAAVCFGVGALWWGGDHFVVGAARLAAAHRVSPVVVGAVLVGFGTSAPELLVSGLAAAGGDMDLGVANIVGSNLANLTLVLGAAAMLATIPATRVAVRREAPLALGSMVLFAVLVQGDLTDLDGWILVGALVVAVALIFRGARDGRSTTSTAIGADTAGDSGMDQRREGLRTLLGLAMTVVGAWAMVEGSVALAERIGLSGGFVGFTLVAVGTSLPELVTAVAAARKGESDLVLGNLLGSNLFNSLAVGATIAFVGSGEVTDERVVVYGVAAMVFVAAVMWGFIITERRLERREGVVLLVMWLVTLPFVYSPADHGSTHQSIGVADATPPLTGTVRPWNSTSGRAG